MKKSSILNPQSSIQRLRIGVFDSGLGGLTVVQAMTGMIKGGHIHYIADTKHAPYGEKSREEILRYSLDITEYFLRNHQIDALVIACNTATTAAIHVLRERYPDLIIIGTEPGIKPAVEQTTTGKVGVLATPATLQSEKYQELANTLSEQKNIELYEQACPGLVEQIEQDLLHTQKTGRMLEQWLSPMREAGVDTIVLGCTHYPLASEIIKKVMQHDVKLIHTGEAIARRLMTLAGGIDSDDSGEASLSLYTTGEINRDAVSKIIDMKSPISKITLF